MLTETVQLGGNIAPPEILNRKQKVKSMFKNQNNYAKMQSNLEIKQQKLMEDIQKEPEESDDSEDSGKENSNAININLDESKISNV
jgi:uncharacterized cupredoxin-like copper-binding protein